MTAKVPKVAVRVAVALPLESVVPCVVVIAAPPLTLKVTVAPVIVAETYYDDPVAAENIRSAMAGTGRRVPFLTQWPLDRGSGAPTGGNCDGTNVLPPFTWDVYGHYGF